jgi:hypothetical protein
MIRQVASVLLVETRRDWAESLAKELFGEHEAALRRRLELKERFSPGAGARLRRLAGQVRRLTHPQYPLASYLELGLAFHHSGLPVAIRRGIEDLARDEIIHTLVSTTTLAEGMDLPFRCVIMVHLNFPDGPVPLATIRNIRGRAGRPYYANDGAFIVVEPDDTNTASFQYFLDTFWNGAVQTPAESTAFSELADARRSRRQEAVRAIQSQLLAVCSEQQIEIADVQDLARDSLVAAVQGEDSGTTVLYGRVLRREAERLMQEPPLLTAASPLQLTGLGRGVALGGLSGDSGIFIRNYLLAERDRVADLVATQSDPWLAVRCAWMPWEAVERSAEYESLSRQWNSAGMQRTPASVQDMEDPRLASEYNLCDALLQPLTFAEIADARLASGRNQIERLTNAIDSASSLSGVLPWTLTGAIRIIDHLGQDDDVFQQLAVRLPPLVQQLQSWMPWPFGIRLVTGPLDRDAAIVLLRASGLRDGSEEDLAEWLEHNRHDAIALVGEEAIDRLLRWLE